MNPQNQNSTSSSSSEHPPTPENTPWELASEAASRAHAQFTTFTATPYTDTSAFDREEYLHNINLSLQYMLLSTTPSPHEQQSILSDLVERLLPDTNSDTDTNSEWSTYSYAPSDPSDGGDEEAIPSGLECDICACRRVTVQFRACIHGACTPCTKGMWGARKQDERHFPGWFPCHLCRAEVREVGMLSEQPRKWWNRGFGETVKVGGRELEVYGWVGVKWWMAKRSKRVRAGLREKYHIGF